MEKEIWIEFTEPVQNHDFRPLILSKNEISPDAYVLECQNKKHDKIGSKSLETED